MVEEDNLKKIKLAKQKKMVYTYTLTKAAQYDIREHKNISKQ